MNRILFIVEGTLTEPAIIKNIEQHFFTSADYPKSSIESLILPATTNIYTVMIILLTTGIMEEYLPDVNNLYKHKLLRFLSAIDTGIKGIGYHDQ